MAAPIAQSLVLLMDVLVVRKIPIPWNTEMGMGAITDNGFLMVDDMVRQFGLTQTQVERIAQGVRQEMERRRHLYRGDRPAAQIIDRTAILVDDGLATGYAMLAASAPPGARKQRGLWWQCLWLLPTR